MEPEKWTDADWRAFVDWCRSRVDLLGDSVWTQPLAFVLGVLVLVWGWWRREQLVQWVKWVY